MCVREYPLFAQRAVAGAVMRNTTGCWAADGVLVGLIHQPHA